VLLAGAVLAAILFVFPSRGTLLVTVSGPGDVAVDALKVWVDGEEMCSGAPCKVSDIESGAHIVRVAAPGYKPTADRAIDIQSGGEAVLAFNLTAGGDGATLSVPKLGEYLRLSVDGDDRGALPVELENLSAGEHVIVIDGSARFARFEQKIELESGKTKVFEPKLTVKEGLAKIELADGAAGAAVVVQCAGQPGTMVDPPVSVKIAAADKCKLVATKSGQQRLEVPLTFEPGQAEITFKVDFDNAGAAAVPVAGGAAAPAPRGATPAFLRAVKAGVAPQATKPAARAGAGSIAVNSIPPAMVLIDGRPVGMAPNQASAPAGRHTVTFVHPKYGKKVVGVNVKPGQRASASVRFKKK
jgi:hypothetical protein